jgi:succinate dehydrogenase flavin-adding protein (antitoxin of CptAB toxin-antitoxin module)
MDGGTPIYVDFETAVWGVAENLVITNNYDKATIEFLIEASDSEIIQWALNERKFQQNG